MNENQFHLVKQTRTISDDHDGGSTGFALRRDEGFGDVTHGELELKHPYMKQQTKMPPQKVATGEPVYNNTHWRDTTVAQSAHRRIGEQQGRDMSHINVNQGMLFQHQSQMQPAHVSWLVTTKEARSMAGPMIGAAAHEAARLGSDLTPDTDLSDHSNRLVQHAQARGGVDPSFERTRKNNTPFMLPGDGIGTVIPQNKSKIRGPIEDANLDQGRRTMRQFLRQGRPAKPQGEQMQLPMQMKTPPPTAGKARRREA